MNKLGNKNIIKKMFGNKEILKEVLNGQEIYSAEEPEEDDFNYFNFSSSNDITVRRGNGAAYNDGTMEYSLNGKTWRKWDYTLISGKKIYFRGTGNTFVRGDVTASYNHSPYFKLTGSDISVQGNIESLMDYTKAKKNIYEGNSFTHLLCNNTDLVDASNLILPRTSLNERIYYLMFNGCTSLVSGPSILPATTLAKSCYENMFNGCSSLTSAPELPATTLKSRCYYQMFKYCSNLVNAPALPATILENSCYSFMFQYCSKLETLPVIYTPSFSDYECCYYMFEGCSKIKLSATQTGEYQTPYRLPITGTSSVGSSSLSGMFDRTGGTFTDTPEVNTTYYTSNEIVLNPMLQIKFSSPNSMTISKNSGGKNDGTMEYSLNGLTWQTWDYSAVSGNTLYFRGTGNTYVKGTSEYSYFTITGNNISVSGNLNALLDYQTENLNLNNVSDFTFPHLFENLSNIIDASNLILPAMILSTYCYYSMFQGCISLTSAPALPATTLANNCYGNMFYGCTALTTAPELPATTLASGCYGFMFYSCTSLTTAPVLPATTLENSCYTNMFANCTSLITASSLPATTLKSRCYYQMFSGCASLTTISALPATTLTNNCYESMFMNCSKIKLSIIQDSTYTNEYRIPSSETGTAETDSLTNMFSNTTGSFTGTPTINKTYYTSNTIV